jgi:hypothetical protein
LWPAPAPVSRRLAVEHAVIRRKVESDRGLRPNAIVYDNRPFRDAADG